MNKPLLLAAGLALAAAASPASAASSLPQNGIVYTVSTGGSNYLQGACTIVADRWTADYGPTTVYAVATAPNAIWTRVRCTVYKGGTWWVDTERTANDGYVLIDGERNGTIPVAGIQICVEAEAQLTVDAHPSARSCINA